MVYTNASGDLSGDLARRSNNVCWDGFWFYVDLLRCGLSQLLIFTPTPQCLLKMILDSTSDYLSQTDRDRVSNQLTKLIVGQLSWFLLKLVPPGECLD